MFKIFIISILLTILSLADGPVLQTGQILSYDGDGDVVIDGSVKDDGYYQAGIARSYSRDGDIVIDNTTGLQWEDNESIEKPWVTQENYDAGDYNNTSGDTATTYCENFTLGGNEDWRLPTPAELSTIVDYAHSNPAISSAFFYTASSDYWSSVTDIRSSHRAWAVDFYYGGYGSTPKNTYFLDVRCVRSGELISPSFERNDEHEIVTDTLTGKQWQDNNIGNQMSWNSAIEHCEGLTLGSQSDWRLPNINELASLVDDTKISPSISSIFHYTASSNYWSSTTYNGANSLAWSAYFDVIGAQEVYDKMGYSFYVRCVRGGEFGAFTCPEGQYKKQGERVCIPGTPQPDPGIWLPNPESGRFIQGTGIYDEEATPVDPPGFTLPTCVEGERLVQGTSECEDTSNTAPTWTQASYDTGLTIEDSTDNPQTIMDLVPVSNDLEGDPITYSIVSISVPGQPISWDNSIVIESGFLKVINLMTNDAEANGDVTVTVKAEAIGGSSNADITFTFNNVQ